MIRWHWGILLFSSKLTKNCNRQVLKVMQGLLILFPFNNAQLSIIAASGEQSKSLVLQPPLHCRLKNIEKNNMLPSPKYLSLWSNFFPGYILQNRFKLWRISVTVGNLSFIEAYKRIKTRFLNILQTLHPLCSILRKFPCCGYRRYYQANLHLNAI